jgi:hypothetical protein
MPVRFKSKTHEKILWRDSLFASLINRNILASLTFYKFCNTVLNKIESHLKGQLTRFFFHHTTRTGQPGQDSRDRTARQGSRYRTAVTAKPRQDSWCRAAEIRQPGQDSWDKNSQDEKASSAAEFWLSCVSNTASFWQSCVNDIADFWLSSDNNRTYLIPILPDTKPVRYWTMRYRTYLMPNLPDTESIRYRTYLILNPSDTATI